MYNANAVGWFDIYVTDMKRAATFYQEVLGVTLVALPDPTGETEMMSFPGNMERYGASGALARTPHARPGAGGTLVYFSVEDCAAQQARVSELGGEIIRPKFSIGEFGFVCIVQDTEGNLVGFNSMK